MSAFRTDEQGKQSPASLNRPYASTYRFFPSGTVYRQDDYPVGSNWVIVGSGGGGDPTLVGRTLVVSELGTAEGERNSWTNHYDTIDNANTDALPGDEIVVFPGTYSEPDAVIKAGIIYNLKEGVRIECADAVIDDLGVDGVFTVFGKGDLVGTVSNAIRILGENSTCYVEAGLIQGEFNTFNMEGFNSFLTVRCTTIRAVEQYVMRTNESPVFDIECDLIDQATNTLSTSPFHINTHGADLVDRILKVKAKKMISNAAGLWPVFLLWFGSEHTTLQLDIEECIHTGNSVMVSLLGGSANVKGNYFGANAGIEALNNGVPNIIRFEGYMECENSAIRMGSALTYIECFNSKLITTTDNVSVIGRNTGGTGGFSTQNGYVSLHNTLVYNDSDGVAAHGIDYRFDDLWLDDVIIITNTAGTKSITAPGAKAVKVTTILSANKVLDAGSPVTNAIAGSLVVIDPLVGVIPQSIKG